MLSYEMSGDDSIIEVKLDGRVAEEEMVALRKECESIARERGGVRMLFVFGDLGTVSPGVVVEGIKADLSLFSGLERLAIVTDKGWYRSLAGITTKPMSFEVESFDLDERDSALAWLKS